MVASLWQGTRVDAQSEVTQSQLDRERPQGPHAYWRKLPMLVHTVLSCSSSIFLSLITFFPQHKASLLTNELLVFLISDSSALILYTRSLNHLDREISHDFHQLCCCLLSVVSQSRVRLSHGTPVLSFLLCFGARRVESSLSACRATKDSLGLVLLS